VINKNNIKQFFITWKKDVEFDKYVLLVKSEKVKSMPDIWIVNNQSINITPALLITHFQCSVGTMTSLGNVMIE
jgi:hypothetical protein